MSPPDAVEERCGCVSERTTQAVVVGVGGVWAQCWKSPEWREERGVRTGVSTYERGDTHLLNSSALSLNPYKL